MPRLSHKRQAALTADAETVRTLYEGACARFGADAVATSLSLIWTYRCICGVQGSLPFRATVSTNAGELLYVAREVCGLPQAAQTPSLTHQHGEAMTCRFVANAKPIRPSSQTGMSWGDHTNAFVETVTVKTSSMISSIFLTTMTEPDARIRS